MRERLRIAATDGLVFGVKWAIVFVVFALAAAAVLGDYTVVRQRAFNGQVAFEYLQQHQKESK